MAKKRKISKEELKSSDSFITLTDKIINSLENNRKLFFSILTIAFLAGSSFVGFNFYKTGVEEKATDSLYVFQEKIDKKQEEITDLEAKEKEKEAKKAEKKEDKVAGKGKTKEELEKELDPLLDSYSLAIKSHSGTNAATASAIELADHFKERKKYKEAVDVLGQVGQELKPQEVLYGLLHAQLGSMKSELNQCDQAINHYKKIVDSDFNKHLYADVFLKMGLCYEKLDDLENAKQVYNKVKDDFSESQAARTAKSFLRLLKVKSAQKTGA